MNGHYPSAATLASWSLADMPSLHGQHAVITGALTGLGWESAKALAQAGARVTLTGRREQAGHERVQQLRALFPQAEVEYRTLDLGSLASVEAFAQQWLAEGRALHILMNNAGVMRPPKRELTADGFELQWGTNFLAHFALTLRLLPALTSDKGSTARVLNLSSLAHRGGKLNFADLQGEKVFNSWASYCQSKLAMLMLSLALQQRFEQAGLNIISVASHPGWARTALISKGPGDNGLHGWANRLFSRWFSHDALGGALPGLYAATAPAVMAGGYYGPNGVYELKGPIGQAKIMPQAQDKQAQQQLWQIAEAQSGVTWEQALAALQAESSPQREAVR